MRAILTGTCGKAGMLKISNTRAPDISAKARVLIHGGVILSKPVTPLLDNFSFGVISLIVPVKRKINPSIICKVILAIIIGSFF